MPRLPRVYIENALCYVTCKGLHNQIIFREKEDYEMYFGLLSKYMEQCQVKVYAYTLMPSHLHLLLEASDKTSISNLMHNLNTAYTKYFNGRYMRKGHLFRERFKAALVEKDPALLLNLTAYIHLNAEKLDLAIQAQTYPYSSYSLYLDYDQQSDRGLKIKEEIEQILTALVGENYADFVSKAAKSGELGKLHKKLQRKGILGTEEFIKKVKREIQYQQQQQQNEMPTVPPAEKKSNPLIGAGTALIIFVLAAGGIYMYFNFSRAPVEAEGEKKVVVVDKGLEDLDKTEWQIKLISADGSAVNNDVISFNKGKFNSAHLAKLDHRNTNYSMVIEGDKMTWETMQSSPQGTASWRGEIKEGNMRGILSLRKKGEKPQDFLFKSLNYRRK